MHSFAPSLSFLFSLFLLPLQLDLSLFGALNTPSAGRPIGLAFAADISIANYTVSPRDLNVVGHNAHRRSHAELGQALSARSSADLMLYPGRRAAGAQFTWFVTGIGACGEFNNPGDFIVALNMEQFDAANHCFADITITANGKTAHAKIVDRCEKCGFGNIDLTTGLYAFFDPTMNGQFEGDWEYGSGAPAPKPTTTKKPTPTPTPTLTPSTTSHRTTTSKATTSSTSVAPTTSAVASSSVVSASSTIASATPTDLSAGNLEQLFNVMLGLGGLIMGPLPSGN